MATAAHGLANTVVRAVRETRGRVYGARLAVLAGSGKAMLEPFTTALIIMGIVAALGGPIAWFGLSGRWQRSKPAAA